MYCIHGIFLITRKNRSQHEECLKKLVEIKLSSQRYLNEIIINLMRKERIKKLIYQIQHLEFEIKIAVSKAEMISKWEYLFS